ncbi:ranaspumin-like [Dendropsophus ebraccatus]|uniref:ranaspumin-like n=1 Tax=Dendropsophus ebraccatus TaxID=150705 RepID=UPI0038322BDF
MKAAIAFLLFVALHGCFGFGNTGFIAGEDIPTIPKDCLEKLLKVDVPETLKKLQELLCLYMKGKKDAGCTVDEILSTKDFLEKFGDKAREVAEKLGLQLLKLVEDLGVSDLVLNVLCELLGDTLESLSAPLGGLGGATNILKGLPVLG